MNFLRKKRVIALLFITFLLFLFLSTNLLGRLLYPVRYQNEIDFHAEQFGVDRFLIAAIIRVESNFQPERISRKGAIGLMQIMPETAQWIYQRRNFSDWTLEHLENPSNNINIGTWYVRWLAEQFQGDVAKVLAAYNAGPGNVAKWLENGVWDGTLQNTDQIPFGETRHFVLRVIYYYDKYSKIYKDGWE